MAIVCRKNEVIHYGTTCLFNYERCPPASGFVPDYAPHGSGQGNCPGGANCINVRFCDFGILRDGLVLTEHDDPATPNYGWPARPRVVGGRLIEDYCVHFHLDGERFAYVTIFELHPPAGSSERMRVFGRGIEVRNVQAAECEPINVVPIPGCHHRVATTIGDVVCHILLDH